MGLLSEGYLLRIIVGETAKYENRHLYEWIVLKAREYGVAGATVIRGMMGYGVSFRIKTSSILSLSDDLPVIVELVDQLQPLEDFLEMIDPVISEGVATLEKVQLRMYRPGKPPGG